MVKIVFFLLQLHVISLAQDIVLDFENQNMDRWYQVPESRWVISNVNPVRGRYSLMHNYDNLVSGTDWAGYFHQPLNFATKKTTWSFKMRYSYTPSAANNWVALITPSSLPDEEIGQNTIIIGVNFIGNDDIIKVWKQDGLFTTCICNTGFNWEEKIKQEMTVGFLLQRSVSGYYSLSIDTSGSNCFEIGHFTDKDITTSQGIWFRYEYTRLKDQGLSIDDIHITGDFIEDDILPFLKSIHFISSSTLELEFSEWVIIHNEQPFYIEGIGWCTTDKVNGSRFLLNLPNSIHPGVSYSMHLPELKDANDNELALKDQKVRVYYPSAFDVVINEIMFDPSPVIGLPKAEYIELLNASQEEILIKGWQLDINEHTVILPYISLPAGEYILLCDSALQTSFSGIHARIIGLKNFPAIRNEGYRMILKDYSGRMIDYVEQSIPKISMPGQQEGGWAVEMMDCHQVCNPENNWSYSQNPKGGTPGERNSVYKTDGSGTLPEIWRVTTTEKGTLMLYFSEIMDSASVVSPLFYYVNNEMGQPYKIVPGSPPLRNAELIFSSPIREYLQYAIQVTSDLCSCSGKPLKTEDGYCFTQPTQADSGDVIINEIMFDPEEEYQEFIELYNNSTKTIDLKDMSIRIGEYDQDNKTLTSEYFPLASHQYVIVSGSFDNIDRIARYQQPADLIKMKSMPVLPNREAVIFLLDKSGTVIDEARYSPAFHSNFLSDTKGVSLERISPQYCGFDADSWRSASSDVDYKTPGRENSQTVKYESATDIFIHPKTITPDEDGMDDVLEIQYHLDGTDYLAHILVFDASGNIMVSGAEMKLVGTQGTLYFNGKKQDGSLLKTGYYILFFEAFNNQGKRITKKEAFVIANK